MRRRQEVEDRIRSTLAEGETVVRTVRARRAWLVLTDRRLVLLGATRLGHPQDAVVDEPLARVSVEERWRWTKLERQLVIRPVDGHAVAVALARTKGQSTRWEQASVLRRIVKDIRHWTTVAEITAEQAAAGQAVDTAFAHVHARALEAVTPADLARSLGLEPQHVRDLLEERFGIVVSKGAALKYTYTERDRLAFDDAAKEKLFGALVDEFGAEGLVERASRVQEDWWETPAAQGLESLLDVVDISVAHVSPRRAPIARWRSRFMWVGFATAAITAILVVPPMVWRSSWEHWRDGSRDRPDAATFLGLAMVAVIVVAVLASLVVNLLA